MTTKRVLSAGQCSADHGSITRTLSQKFDVEIVAVERHAEALDQLRQGKIDLVLVNRVFDLDGSSGLELIRQIKSDDSLASTPVMLVSNFADAQAEAESAGAKPGFGKAELGDANMLARVEAVLG